jgi:hypothetical protein
MTATAMCQRVGVPEGSHCSVATVAGKTGSYR